MTNREGTGRRRACSWFDQVEPQPRFPWGWWLGTVLLALAAIACAVTGLAAQGPVTVANPAPIAQTRWVVCALPPVDGAALTPSTVGGVFAVPGPLHGVHSRLWFLHPTLAAGEVKTSHDWLPVPLDDADAAWRPTWPALDRPLAGLVPRLSIAIGDGAAVEAPCTSVQQLEAGPVRQVWRLELHAAGWHLVVWQTAWADQLAVDVAGYVVWSDPANAALAIENVTIGVAWGEPMQMAAAKRQGLQQSAAGTWTLWRGRVPTAFAFPFRGTLLGDQPPLVAAAEWPDDSWFGFGVRPKVPPVGRAHFDGFLAGSGTLIDWRPGAANLDTGSTGDQSVFGATSGLAAAGGDPWALRELVFAADDGPLRAGHYLERDGTPVTRLTHPRWETWSISTERNSRDRLGRGPEVWGWDHVGARGVLIDDQHRCDGPELAALALTGDPMLQDDLLLRLNCDEARAKLLRGQADAPRAGGRWWQSMAKLALLVDQPTRQRIRAVSVAELDVRLASWATQAGPVRPTWIIKDDRVLPGGQLCWVPWNEALLVMGALEQARTWERLGDHETAERFLAFARELARVVVDYGILRSGDSWLVVTGCKWFDGGVAPPAGYYDYPRQGAGTAPVAGIDMLIGGGGWIDWCAGAIVCAADAGSEKAQAILRDCAPRPGAREDVWRWWACR